MREYVFAVLVSIAAIAIGWGLSLLAQAIARASIG